MKGLKLSIGLLATVAALTAASYTTAGEHGAKMPEQGVTLGLSDAITRLEDQGSYQGKIRGRITEVCEKKGCFMILVDGEQAARVVFKDYGFFVPKDTRPGMSTVFGELSSRQLSAEQVAHYAADAGRPTAEAKAIREYTIVASAVSID